jgi:hypothetical protein
MTQENPEQRTGGRPPKFDEPRRPITVTLPERTLRQLSAISLDRAQAIVKVTDAVAGSNRTERRLVELIEVAPGKAVIVVGPCLSLKQIPWLRLVEIAPGRNLLILPSGKAVDSLEVAILDIIENLSTLDDRERALLEELRGQLCRLRREDKISKAEIIFFDVPTSGRARSPQQG